jgi:tetratricopeptide (TPR) repeat protein
MLSLEPANAHIHLRLGQILSTLDPAAALGYLAQVQVLDSSLSGSASRLLDVLQTARLASDPAFPYLQAGRILAAGGDWALAREAFLRATELNPRLADAWAYLGEADYQISPQDLTRSRQSLDEALRLAPHSLTSNAFMALYWQRQGSITAVTYYRGSSPDRQSSGRRLWTGL